MGEGATFKRITFLISKKILETTNVGLGNLELCNSISKFLALRCMILYIIKPLGTV